MRFSTLLTALLVAPAALVGAGRPSKVPKGFVTTKGNEFYVDGKKFVSLVFVSFLDLGF